MRRAESLTDVDRVHAPEPDDVRGGEAGIEQDVQRVAAKGRRRDLSAQGRLAESHGRCDYSVATDDFVLQFDEIAIRSGMDVIQKLLAELHRTGRHAGLQPLEPLTGWGASQTRL